ncbi:unnamed protein product [Owenia fusiformis]|uniref:Uncharacterized protein n=1 Tax=Owenia fusiformis TaxID=6347 RepID=A0A8S4NNA5_OWEFU|nr:unnamed protein product [Owenia fusiformis]
MTKILIGAILGGIAFIITFLLLIWVCIRRKRGNFLPPEESNPDDVTDQDSLDDHLDLEPAAPVTSTPVHHGDRPNFQVDGLHKEIAEVNGNHGDMNSNGFENLNHTGPNPSRPNNIGQIHTRPHHTGPHQTGPGSPRGLTKTSNLMLLTVVTVIAMVYASCEGPQVDISIEIPLDMHIDSFKVFFHHERGGSLDVNAWSQKDTTNVHIFDVPSAQMIANEPCFEDILCPRAASQNLAGCDPMVRSCICDRGFDQVGDLCMDKDECGEGLFMCDPLATCKNTIGSYMCVCEPGFYSVGATCQPCGGLCEEGFYESSVCNSTHDRVCTDVSQPLEGDGADYPYTAIKGSRGLSLSGSSNTFMEDLHVEEQLTHTSYLTDNGQSTDSFWLRQSRLRINFGVEKSNLVPEYGGVEHQSDNLFMMKSPKGGIDKRQFQNIIDRYCKHPIPDYYSVTMEIYRDRTTATEPIVCNSRNPKKIKCPEGYNNGDIFYHRTLNDPCKKMATFPEKLVSVANSMVCSDATDLLTKLFNGTVTKDFPVPFLTEKCSRAISSCNKCLKQHNCELADIFDRQCCAVRCYTGNGKNCKQAVRPECSNLPTECAMGDAYLYTLQPVFENIRQEFQCHKRYVPPDSLFQVWYSISLPNGITFYPGTRRQPIHSPNLKFHNEGTSYVDFLEIHHKTKLNFEEDIILLGQFQKDDTADIGSQHVDYSAFPLKKPEEFTKKPVEVFHVNNNVLVTSIQVEKPFEISTSSWLSSSGCERNTSRFHEKQPMYNKQKRREIRNPYEDDDDATESEKVMSNDDFTFQLRAKDKDKDKWRPEISFNIPENASVLWHYFKNKPGPWLFTDDQLHSDLARDEEKGVWKITIEGEMSGCPGYLGVVVNDGNYIIELLKYDVIIDCPADFTLHITVPFTPIRMDKLFEIQLTDPVKTYSIFLTSVHFRDGHVYPGISIDTKEEVNVRPPWSAAIMITIATSFVLVTLLVIYLCIQCAVANQQSKPLFEFRAANENEEKDEVDFSESGTKRNKKRATIITLYVFIQILYSFLFTFTALSAILLLTVRTDKHSLEQLQKKQFNNHEKSRKIATEINLYKGNEIDRQEMLAHNMFTGCNNYVQNLTEHINVAMKNFISENHQLLSNDSKSVSAYMEKLINFGLKKYDMDLADYMTGYNKSIIENFDPVFIAFRAFMEKIYKTSWLDFPRRYYNITKTTWRVFNDDAIWWYNYTDWMEFLDEGIAEDIMNHQTEFNLRFQQDYPTVNTISNPSLKSSIEFFDAQSVDMETLDTHRFYGNQLLHPSVDFESFQGDEDGTDEEYSPEDTPLQASNDFMQLDNFFHFNLDLTYIQYVFLVLDVLLLVYRFSRMYKYVHQMQHGIPEKVKVTPSEGRITITENKLHKPHDDTTLSDIGVEDSTMDSKRSMLINNTQNPHSVARGNRGSHNQEQHYKNQTTGCTLYKNKSLFGIVKRILQSDALPKFALLCIAGLCIYLVVVATDYVVTMTMIGSYGITDAYTADLKIALNATNSYIAQYANYLNTVAMETFTYNMFQELYTLNRVMLQFNHFQRLDFQKYIVETCSISSKINPGQSCDLSPANKRLELTLLPCNFMPITPHFFTGFNHIEHSNELKSDFQPCVDAARTIVFKTACLFLVVLCCVIIFHLVGTVTFYFLKLKQHINVKMVYHCENLTEGRHDNSADEYGLNVELRSRLEARREKMTPERGELEDNSKNSDLDVSRCSQFSETKV